MKTPGNSPLTEPRYCEECIELGCNLASAQAGCSCECGGHRSWVEAAVALAGQATASPYTEDYH